MYNCSAMREEQITTLLDIYREYIHLLDIAEWDNTQGDEYIQGTFNLTEGELREVQNVYWNGGFYRSVPDSWRVARPYPLRDMD